MKCIYTLCRLAVLVFASLQCFSATADERPNLVVIVVDDQRWDEYGAAGHAYLHTPNMDRLAREGVRFTSSYATTPLCSPNRASILTGQYASRHGIIDNIARDASSHRLKLFPIALQAAGYETAHIGKWHMGNDPTPRPGYDYWVGIPGQGRSINPELYEDGKIHQQQGYLTDILTERAVNFINKKRSKPFFLYIGHKAVHPDILQKEDASVDLSSLPEFIPAPRHVGTYKDAIFPRRKNYHESKEQLSRKPVLLESLKQRDTLSVDVSSREKTIRDRSEMLLAVDEGLGRIIETLEQKGILNDTVILFTSDNGYFYGEHQLSVERRLPYEEAVRVPMLLRYPQAAKAGSEIDDFVLSIDIAPTMLQLADAEIGEHIQGKSFIQLLKDKPGKAGEKHWRDSFLIEYVSYEKPMNWLIDTSYKAVRMGQYKYIHWIHHPEENELYDLDSDPYELSNRVNEPAMRSVVNSLKDELNILVPQAMGLAN